MSLKIRIVSFQNAQNYGAILQAYGLMKTIDGLGFNDVAFINYKPRYLTERYSVFSRRFFKQDGASLTNRVKFILSLPVLIGTRLYRNYVLNLSRKHLLRQTKNVYKDVESVKNVECNLIICGSDQIWNTWITEKPDPIFYCEGKYNGLKRKITYAASTELNTFRKKENVEIIKSLLDNIDSISVREEAVKNYLELLLERDIHLCVDPTILCGKKPFLSIASRRRIKNPYILVYAYDIKDDKISRLIRSIPEYQNYEIHYLCFGASSLSNLLNMRIHSSVSIEDFLSFFLYADYVVTNSFHGLAFSLLFEKNFNVSFVDGLSTRIESLLNQIHLYGRLVRNFEEVTWNNIDYEATNKKLNEIREESLTFLKNNLNELK